jgi:signal transduction histidine kinase
VRNTISYTLSVIAGLALAVLATLYSVPDNVYVMLAVLLVVSVALSYGTGPALAAALTSVIGDDIVLAGRLPPPQQWKDLTVFAFVAIVVGWLVASKRRQQIQSERLAIGERQLRTERDAILAAISHDVRNPLAVIAGSARRGLADHGVRGDVTRLFRRIDSAAMQAAHLIDALSDLHSLDGDRIELDVRPSDLRRTAEAAVDQMEAVAQNHTLRLSAPARPVIAEYDERRIQRVLQNLIGNAIKYSPEGGPIDVAVHVSQPDARITVRDRGVGIPVEARPHIFERGYRASTVGTIPGSGLGLFISAEIVRRHGGSITCLAPSDGGTIVELQLPLAGARHQAEGRVFPDGGVAARKDRDGLPGRVSENRLVGAD